MSGHVAYLSLGSNLSAEPEGCKCNLDKAVAALKRLPETVVLKVSSYIETDPVGYKDQPMFLNAAVKLATALSPHALLGAALGIEAAMGRIRTIKNGPRIIDIDILMYDDVKIDTPELILPHPRMNERDFVQIPLREIENDESLV